MQRLSSRAIVSHATGYSDSVLDGGSPVFAAVIALLIVVSNKLLCILVPGRTLGYRVRRLRSFRGCPEHTVRTSDPCLPYYGQDPCSSMPEIVHSTS